MVIFIYKVNFSRKKYLQWPLCLKQSISNQVRYLEPFPLTGLSVRAHRLRSSKTDFVHKYFPVFFNLLKIKVFCVENLRFGQSWVVLSWFYPNLYTQLYSAQTSFPYWLLSFHFKAIFIPIFEEYVVDPNDGGLFATTQFWADSIEAHHILSVAESVCWC